MFWKGPEPGICLSGLLRSSRWILWSAPKGKHHFGCQRKFSDAQSFSLSYNLHQRLSFLLPRPVLAIATEDASGNVPLRTEDAEFSDSKPASPPSPWASQHVLLRQQMAQRCPWGPPILETRPSSCVLITWVKMPAFYPSFLNAPFPKVLHTGATANSFLSQTFWSLGWVGFIHVWTFGTPKLFPHREGSGVEQRSLVPVLGESITKLSTTNVQ